MAVSQVLTNLYLGNQYSTTITDVDTIISIGCNSKNKTREGIPINHYKFSIKDSDESVLTEIYEESSKIIHQELQNHNKVLVHCKGGINRSPMIIIAYLCRYSHYSIQDAINHVKSVRKGARIQPHYLEQLEHWIENIEKNLITKHTA